MLSPSSLVEEDEARTGRATRPRLARRTPGTHSVRRASAAGSTPAVRAARPDFHILSTRPRSQECLSTNRTPAHALSALATLDLSAGPCGTNERHRGQIDRGSRMVAADGAVCAPAAQPQPARRRHLSRPLSGADRADVSAVGDSSGSRSAGDSRPPAFLLRTFIVFHDCGHGSFHADASGQTRWVGRLTRAVSSGSRSPTGATTTPSTTAPPATSTAAAPGDMPTSPLTEYYASRGKQRLGYRLFRNPLVMFGLGPIWSLMIGPRLCSRAKRRRLAAASSSPTSRSLALVAICGSRRVRRRSCSSRCRPPSSPGWRACGCSTSSISSRTSTGRAASAGATPTRRCEGSSYLKLPKVLQFFTGNIGLHHVHHLSARVPNYNLQRAHDENEIFRAGPGADDPRQPALAAAEADRHRQRPAGHLG